MNDVATNLILISFFGKGILHLLPRGEKNSLTAPLKFLISLSIVVLLATPFSKGLQTLREPEISWPEEAKISAEELLWERSCNAVSDSTHSAFPKETFQLEFIRGKEGTVERVFVFCEKEEKGTEIALYLNSRYGLDAKWMEGENKS